MRITNRTTYPTHELRFLIRFAARGQSYPRLTIEVVPARQHATGTAWYWEQHIVIRLPPESAFPKQPWRRHRGGVMNHDWADWREAAVALAAHELMHIELGSAYHRSHSQYAVEMICEATEHLVLKNYRQALA